MTINPYQSPTFVVGGGISNYRSASSLASILTGLFLGNATLDILITWVIRPCFFRYGPGFVAEYSENSFEHLFVAIYFISLSNALLYLAGSILFFVFLYRAHSNARALGATQLKYSATWTIASFFIPLVNLYIPYEAVRDIYRFSVIDNDERPPPRSTPIVSWWWTVTVTWWVTIWILPILARLQVPFGLIYSLELLDPLVSAIALVLLVLWIRQIASRQAQLSMRRASVDAF